jgi:hypothetical protein
MPTAFSNLAYGPVDVPEVHPTPYEWADPYTFIQVRDFSFSNYTAQELHHKYSDFTGSVKIVAPGWKPACLNWKPGAVFRPKVQQLGLISGENRQELAHEMGVRVSRFVNGTPLKRNQRPTLFLRNGIGARLMVRKLQIYIERYGIPDVESLKISIEHCIPTTVESLDLTEDIVKQAEMLIQEWRINGNAMERGPQLWKYISHVPDPLPRRRRDGSFWMFDPVRQKSLRARIVGPVRDKLDVKQVIVEQTCLSTGTVNRDVIDEEDVDSYISNGFSKDAAKLATNCLLCEVCLVSCHFPVEVADLPVDESVVISPPTELELQQIRQERPAFMCSGCSMVVHADCLSCKEDFTANAIAHHLIRTNRDWFCHKCISSPESWMNAYLKYGYQAGQSMTRRAFEKQGVIFKERFGVGENESDDSAIERQFWKLIDSPGSENISVLYGSDLDSKQVTGSDAGPLSNRQSSWELRHLALNQESVLRHLPGSENIEGVSRPWMYLGNPFSTFCWHTEDQFLCSVNYLHEGSPKIWYTVPGSERTKLEEAMKILLPDLQAKNTDLQHQLVTMVNPITLCSPPFRIKIGRVVQRPGDFIVTFPQAYHAGFNTGINLAEAVNVAVPDWLPHASVAIKAYKAVKRPSVFCVEELAWKMASAVLSGQETRRAIACFCIQVLEGVFEELNTYRKHLCRDDLKLPVVFMNPDDKIVCKNCNQFCYSYASLYQEGTFCGPCSLDRRKSPPTFVMRRSVKTILDIIENLKTKLDSCTDLRRSVRASKRIKHI